MTGTVDLPSRARSADELRELVAANEARLAEATATETIEWAAATFGDRWAVAASMQDGVLAHLAAQVVPGVRLVFLDTGYHFPETLATRDDTAARYPARVINVIPRQTVEQQDAQFGPELFSRDPDLCCALRKTQPLDEALEGYEAWATGIRRAQSTTRASTPVLGFDSRRGLVKLAPLATWSDEQIAEYAQTNDVVRNPLLDKGYPSIGCWPCTRAVGAGEGGRAGRWADSDKTECGLHL